MKCPTCGYENRESTPYCDICQTPFAGPRLDSSIATLTPVSQLTPVRGEDIPADVSKPSA